MPPVRVVFYQEGDKVPVQDWVDKRSVDEQDACYERIEELRDYGYELGFPAAEHLEDGIWQLRVRVKKVRLRMLYFFYERKTAAVTHGFHKDTKKVPPIEIQKAKDKRARHRTGPESHTLHWERDDE
ncbi:MAG: type II toxin-antitoxin system RelE/ParE family toxin [Desulfomonile tiedjei]|nr:type II toxin-antitoxin system RelE/ParE family toxin [Desulfomonile tiedjei]